MPAALLGRVLRERFDRGFEKNNSGVELPRLSLQSVDLIAKVIYLIARQRKTDHDDYRKDRNHNPH